MLKLMRCIDLIQMFQFKLLIMEIMHEKLIEKINNSYFWLKGRTRKRRILRKS